MLAGDKNLKDSGKDIVKDNFSVPASYEVKSFYSGSYTKTHKLITALYMVTDIMDKDEPIRNKLRILGTEIISDMHATPIDAGDKIAEMMSFLSIAGAMNFISEMNCAVLKKEFIDLKNSIQEHIDIKPTWISEFLSTPTLEDVDLQKNRPPLFENMGKFSKGHGIRNNRQSSGTRIGVQKGSTLLKALSDKTLVRSLGNNFSSNNNLGSKSEHAQDFEILKKQRRDDIISIIKNYGGSATIKDIKTKIDSNLNGESTFSEKTLQRELMSLIKDGVLNKTGEKRWSRYFVKN